MKKATLTALKTSIKHWQNNCKAVVIEQASIASYHCALCERFSYDCLTPLAEKCPVYAKTGKNFCDGSPYYRAADAYTFARDNGGPISPFIEAAKEELDFLISLLPEGEKM